MMRFEYDGTQITSFLEGVKLILDKPINVLTAAFATIGYKDVIGHFNQAKGPEGPWPKRSDETQKAYARMNKTNKTYNPSNRLLQLTGSLRQNFMPGNIISKGVSAILFYNPTPYGGYHDEGTGSIPKREFMWLSDEAQEKMGEFILDQMVKA